MEGRKRHGEHWKKCGVSTRSEDREFTTGPLITPEGELPATGRRVTVPFALVGTTRDERLATVHNYHDRLEFLAQLGLMPAPAA